MMYLIYELFQDARDLQVDAVEMLAQGRVATRPRRSGGRRSGPPDALVLARTGEELECAPETGAGLRQMASLGEAVREARLLRRYYSRKGSLHGECFYNGLCDPLEDTERRIRATSPAYRPVRAAAECRMLWKQGAWFGQTPFPLSRRNPGLKRCAINLIMRQLGSR